VCTSAGLREVVTVVGKDSARFPAGKYKRRKKAILQVTYRSAVFNSAMNDINDDSPWDADPNPSYTHQSEWSKITSDFTNVRQPNRLKTRDLILNYQGRLSRGHNRRKRVEPPSRFRHRVC